MILGWFGTALDNEQIGKSLEPGAADFPTGCPIFVQYYLLVGGLEHEFYDFPYIGINNPNWLSYFSELLKPPTSLWLGALLDICSQLCSKLWVRAVENSHEQHEFLVSHSTVATFAMSAAFRRVVAAAALAVTSVLAETQQFATVPLLGGPLDDNLEIPTQFQH